MPFNDAAMTVGANAIKAAVLYAQIHSGDPGAAGTANNHAVARQAITWGSTTGPGSFSLSSPLAFTGLSAGATCTWISLWSASTAGTTYGNEQLTGDTTANSAGEFNVATLTATGSST